MHCNLHAHTIYDTAISAELRSIRDTFRHCIAIKTDHSARRLLILINAEISMSSDYTS